MALAINPQTKVGQVLDAYPGIEEELIAWVPAFSKLRNPILRKTVAKVATLEQAARIGGVSVRELVLKLRQAAGQDSTDVDEIAAPAQPSSEWLHGVTVTRHLDADTLLARGENPLGVVRQCVAELKTGEALRLTSTFRPAPLLDTLARSGVRGHCDEVAANEFVTYLGPQTETAGQPVRGPRAAQPQP
jgi:hypothetical protein